MRGREKGTAREVGVGPLPTRTVPASLCMRPRVHAVTFSTERCKRATIFVCGSADLQPRPEQVEEVHQHKADEERERVA